MVILVSQVPLWAVLMSLVYLCKRKLTSVVRPTRQWGPGDPQVALSDPQCVRNIDHNQRYLLHI